MSLGIPRRSALLGAALALLGSACAQPLGKNPSSETAMNPQDTQNWKTYCFGRNVVRLPADAKIGQRYDIGTRPFVYQAGLTPDEANRKASARESALRTQKHKLAANSFRERIPLDGGSAALLYYKYDSETEFLTSNAWFVDANAGKVWTRESDISGEREAFAKSLLQRLARTIRGRAPDEIPTTPGFCVEQGVVGNSEFQVEGYDIYVSSSAMPHVSLHISSTVVGEPLSKLLDRAPSGIAKLAQVAGGTRTLRSRDRALDGIAGQELLLRMSAEGTRVHYFRWESPGVPESLTQPHVSFELTTLIPDDNGKFHDSYFKTDEEALAFWDAVLASFRIRPGAV